MEFREAPADFLGAGFQPHFAPTERQVVDASSSPACSVSQMKPLKVLH